MSQNKQSPDDPKARRLRDTERLERALKVLADLSNPPLGTREARRLLSSDDLKDCRLRDVEELDLAMRVINYLCNQPSDDTEARQLRTIQLLDLVLNITANLNKTLDQGFWEQSGRQPFQPKPRRMR